ncbi:DNA-binding protein [Mycobacterium sp. PS03-16]|uniref:helix-turn-helix domain-containing protein n=1 Tax=Mycobacterium sp. PS03-16 TaxID=2559611 RepID=UPI00107385A4|nr:DNA-binding protein [Mycobacterium sp. PS03-16]
MSGNDTSTRPADYWSTQQAAQYLGVPVRNVRNAVARGSLRAYRIGGLYKFDPADVRDFVKPVNPDCGGAA